MQYANRTWPVRTLAVIAAFIASGQVAATTCSGPPPTKPITGRIVLVSSTVARPDDGIDDTVAIQAALDSLQPGDAFIFDLPGVYEHNLALYVRRPGVIVDGGVGVLKGTNPDNQALWVQSDNVEIRNVYINNVTNGRRTSYRHAAISVVSADEGQTVLHGISILGNSITGDGTTSNPGTPTQAAASGGGIYVKRVDGFVISANNIQRTLADGIHLTQGARNGRVIGNGVVSSGDDGIAMVSFLPGDWRTVANAVPDTAAWAMVSNIHVKDNIVRGNYWGRGISVVGGQNITIENNSAEDSWRAAGIYLAHEYSYNTFGLNNVLVRNNTIKNVGKTQPTWLPTGPGFEYVAQHELQPNNTGHGGIEVYGPLDENEWLNVTGVQAYLPVKNLSIENNLVLNSKWPGLRIGATSHRMGLIGVKNNQLDTGWTLQIIPQTTNSNGTYTTFDQAPYCTGNTSYGAIVTSPACTGSAPPVVTGFTCNPGQL